IFVNINHQQTIGQLDYIVRDCEIKILVLDSRRAREMASIEWPKSLETVIIKDSKSAHPRMVSLEEIPARLEPPPQVKMIDMDTTAILYTSGSTGKPKGVVLTHRNIVDGARSVARYLGLGPNDRILSQLQLSFDYGMNQITTSFLVGATIVLQTTS